MRETPGSGENTEQHVPLSAPDTADDAPADDDTTDTADGDDEGAA
jgi:hypothetical protein